LLEWLNPSRLITILIEGAIEMSPKGKNEYRKNFLTNVIARIDYPKILELSERKPPSTFQGRVKGRYPLLRELKGETVKYKQEKEKFEISKEEKISWQFSNKDKNIIVHVDPEFLTIEAEKYTTFDEFLHEIKFVLGIFKDLYPVEIINKIGLRHINQIKINEGDPLNWTDLINPSLCGVIHNFASNDGNVLRSMHTLEMKISDERKIKFNFGIFNSEYPNPVSRREFVLDYDCREDEDFPVSEIETKLKDFNDIIYDWFEISICEGLRTIMNS